MTPNCPQQHLVDRHFALAIAVAEECALREHLPQCAICSARYDRQLLLSKLDPAAPSAQQRLGRGLGLMPRPVATGRWVVSSLAFAASLAIAVSVWRVSADPSDGFAARGPSTEVGLTVWRSFEGGLVRIDPSIRADDELAFSYLNRSGKKHLLVFGVDEHRHIYWYHPAWVRQQDNPSAIAIEAGNQPHVLAEAIRHPLDGRSLTLYGVFTDRALTVTEVESIVELGSELVIPQAIIQSRTVEVSR